MHDTNTRSMPANRPRSGFWITFRWSSSLLRSLVRGILRGAICLLILSRLPSGILVRDESYHPSAFFSRTGAHAARRISPRMGCYAPRFGILVNWLAIDFPDQRSVGFATMGLLGPLPASMSRIFVRSVGISVPSLYPWVPTPIPQALDTLLGPQLHPAPRLIGR